jgi:hypothetical protein
MKKGILAIVVAVVIAVGAVVAFKVIKSKPSDVSTVSTPTGVEQPLTQVISPKGQVAIADVIPNDVVVYLSAKNARATWDLVKNSNFWKKASALKIWQAAQLDANMAAFKEQFKNNLGFEFSEENFLGLFGQDLSVALVGSKEGLTNPQLLLLAQTDPRADVKGKFDVLLEKMKANVTTESVEYNGQKITRIRNPQVPGPEFNYAFIGNIFALGVGVDDSGIRKVVDLVSKKTSDSLASSAQYKDAVEVLKVRGDLRGLVFINMTKIVDLVKALPTPEGTPQSFAQSIEQTLGAIKSISGAVGFDRGMLVKLFFAKNKEVKQPEILASWEANPKAAESINFLPEDTLLLTASNSIDFAQIWDGWQKNLETQNPDQSKAIADGVASFEKDSGLKIKEDILALLGEEVCFAVTNIDMGGLFPFPHVAILAKVKDEQKALDVMKRLSDYAISKSAPTGVSPGATSETPAPATEASPETATPTTETPTNAPLTQMTTGKETYNGVDINFLEVSLPYQTLNPSYAVVSNLLIIGGNKETVKSIIDVTKGTKSSVTKSKNFKESTINFNSKVNQLAYVNVDRALALVIEITKWANNLQRARGEAAAQTDQLIQENVLPLLDTLKVFKAVAVEAVNQDHGIEETVYVKMEDLKE